uniref:Uncharacterized protein n=1 Tax=Setaria italica TaxID=4555 RepID=K3XU29_SETIT
MSRLADDMFFLTNQLNCFSYSMSFNIFMSFLSLLFLMGMLVLEL